MSSIPHAPVPLPVSLPVSPPVCPPPDIVFAVETPADAGAIEALNATTFGPGRHVRAAARLRERGPHDPALSFTASQDGRLVGSVRLTPIVVGEGESGVPGHLLGPLVVVPALKRLGIGRALIERSCRAASALDGPAFVLLVGDAPYYARTGFAVVRGPVMPGPVDPARLLVRWHEAEARLSGTVLHALDAPVDAPPDAHADTAPSHGR